MSPQHDKMPPRKRGYVLQYQLFSSLPKMIPYLINEYNRTPKQMLEIKISYSPDILDKYSTDDRYYIQIERWVHEFENNLIVEYNKRHGLLDITFIHNDSDVNISWYYQGNFYNTAKKHTYNIFDKVLLELHNTQKEY